MLKKISKKKNKDIDLIESSNNLSKKDNKKENKINKRVKNKKDTTSLKTYTINLNSTHLPKNIDRWRILAIIAQQVKKDYGYKLKSTFVTNDGDFIVPYKFTTYDLILFAKIYSIKEIYMEIVEENNKDIDTPFFSFSFDTIELHCTSVVYEDIKKIYESVIYTDFDIDVYEFDLTEFNDKIYKEFLNHFYEIYMHIGNELFKEGGYISVFDKDGKEIIVPKNENFFDNYDYSYFEYYVIRSSKKEKALIYVTNDERLIGFGFSDDEKKELDKIIDVYEVVKKE